MPLYINTRGQPTAGIGICARCARKFPLARLSQDPNIPGLYVCDADKDVYDPYLRAPRQMENIVLPFVRPDEPLTVLLSEDFNNDFSWDFPSP